MAISKRTKANRSKVDIQKTYPVGDALTLIKQCATAKFDESVDVSVALGIDAKKSDQTVRGSVVLPAGSGKTKRVAVFARRESGRSQGRRCRHHWHGRSGSEDQGRLSGF